MARIEDSGGRSGDNAFTRLFGNEKLGYLFSRIQSAIIRTGSELEPMLRERTTHPIVGLQNVFDATRTHGAVEVVYGDTLVIEGEKGIKLDVLIVDHQTKSAKVIEIKDGDVFDTKKSAGELVSLTRFATALEKQYGYPTTIYFCSFNQEDKSAIMKGAKSTFTKEQVMTGRELCDLLGSDYDELVAARKRDQSRNLQYFLDQLLEIEEVRDHIVSAVCADSQS